MHTMCLESQCAFPVMKYPGALHCIRHTCPTHVLTPAGSPWPRCTNFNVRRCQKLCQHSHENSFCFACASGNTPCCNSHNGCANYVRQNADGNKSCAVHHQRRKIPCHFEAPTCIKGCKRKRRFWLDWVVEVHCVTKSPRLTGLARALSCSCSPSFLYSCSILK